MHAEEKLIISKNAFHQLCFSAFGGAEYALGQWDHDVTWDEAKARCEAQSGQLGKGSIKVEK